MEYTQIAAKNMHYKRLMRFIKLNDLLVTRCNLNIAIQVLSNVKEALTFTDEKLIM